jgi:hypothetical protein
VREEWGGLDEEAYKASLTRDLNCPWRRSGAVARLWQYHRAEAEQMILSMLSKNVYDERHVQAEVDRLCETWPVLGDKALEHLKQNEPLFEAATYDLTVLAHSPSLSKSASARRVLTARFPEFEDFGKPSPCWPLRELTRFVERLDTIRSPGIDDKLAQVCGTILDHRAVFDAKAMDEFMLAAMEYFREDVRLRDRFMAYCNTRLREDGSATGQRRWEKWRRVWDQQMP